MQRCGISWKLNNNFANFGRYPTSSNPVRFVDISLEFRKLHTVHRNAGSVPEKVEHDRRETRDVASSYKVISRPPLALRAKLDKQSPVSVEGFYCKICNMLPPSPSHVLRAHDSQINALSFSTDNERLYSGDAGGQVIVTSTRTLRPLASWRAHIDGILGVEEWNGDSVITFV